MTTLSAKQLFEQAENDEVIVLPADTHRLEVTSCTVKNGNGFLPMFRVVGGPNAGRRVMAGTQVLTDASASIFFRNVKGFGITKDIIDTLPDDVEGMVAAIAPLLVGRIVDVALKIDPWKGEDRNKIEIGGIKLVGQKDGAGVVQEVPGASAPPAAAAAAAAPAAVAPAPTPAAQPAPAEPAQQPQEAAPEAPPAPPQAPPPPAAAPATPPPAAAPAAPPAPEQPAAVPPPPPTPEAAAPPPPPTAEAAAPPPPPAPEVAAPPPPTAEQAATNGAADPSAGVPPVPPVPGAGKKTPF